MNFNELLTESKKIDLDKLLGADSMSGYEKYEDELVEFLQSFNMTVAKLKKHNVTLNELDGLFGFKIKPYTGSGESEKAVDALVKYHLNVILNEYMNGATLTKRGEQFAKQTVKDFILKEVGFSTKSFELRLPFAIAGILNYIKAKKFDLPGLKGKSFYASPFFINGECVEIIKNAGGRVLFSKVDSEYNIYRIHWDTRTIIENEHKKSGDIIVVDVDYHDELVEYNSTLNIPFNKKDLDKLYQKMSKYMEKNPTEEFDLAFQYTAPKTWQLHSGITKNYGVVKHWHNVTDDDMEYFIKTYAREIKALGAYILTPNEFNSQYFITDEPASNAFKQNISSVEPILKDYLTSIDAVDAYYKKSESTFYLLLNKDTKSTVKMKNIGPQPELGVWSQDVWKLETGADAFEIIDEIYDLLFDRDGYGSGFKLQVRSASSNRLNCIALSDSSELYDAFRFFKLSKLDYLKSKNIRVNAIKEAEGKYYRYQVNFIVQTNLEMANTNFSGTKYEFEKPGVQDNKITVEELWNEFTSIYDLSDRYSYEEIDDNYAEGNFDPHLPFYDAVTYDSQKSNLERKIHDFFLPYEKYIKYSVSFKHNIKASIREQTTVMRVSMTQIKKVTETFKDFLNSLS